MDTIFGVRIAAVYLESSPLEAEYLLEWTPREPLIHRFSKGTLGSGCPLASHAGQLLFPQSKSCTVGFAVMSDYQTSLIKESYPLLFIFIYPLVIYQFTGKSTELDVFLDFFSKTYSEFPWFSHGFWLKIRWKSPRSWPVVAAEWGVWVASCWNQPALVPASEATTSLFAKNIV